MVICAGVGVLYHVDHLLRRDEDRLIVLFSFRIFVSTRSLIGASVRMDLFSALCNMWIIHTKLATLPRNVRAFFWYLLFSLPLGIAVPTWLLASGKAPELSHSDKRCKVRNISNDELMYNTTNAQHSMWDRNTIQILVTTLTPTMWGFVKISPMQCCVAGLQQRGWG